MSPPPATSVRAWLRALPEPANIRVDGETIIAVTKTARRWTLCERAIGPDWRKLEALDAKGHVLRRLDDDAGDDDEPREPKEAEPVDAESMRFKLFAKLLADAYKDAHGQNERLFMQALKLAETTTAALRSYEKAIQANLQAQAAALEEKASGGLGGIGDMADTMVQIADAKRALDSMKANGGKPT